MTTQIDPLFYNIFDPPLVDESTTEYEYFEHKEMNVVVKDLTKYEIATCNVESCIYPHNRRYQPSSFRMDNRIFVTSVQFCKIP